MNKTNYFGNLLNKYFEMCTFSNPKSLDEKKKISKNFLGGDQLGRIS